MGQMGLHLHSISGGKKRGHSGGSSHESKSRAIWKESQRTVRDEDNEVKETGRRCIKKRTRKKCFSASLIDVAEMNYGYTKNPNCNIERK